MEKINLHNYEASFLDFAEGNLNDAQIRELEIFLQAHPKLRAELEDFEPISLSDSRPESHGWSDLKKPTLYDLQNNKDLRDTFFIQAIEGLHTEIENRILESLLENKTSANDFEIWKKTILEENLDEKINPDSLFQFGLDQPISDFNYDAWLTAKTEGLLDTNQIEELSTFAKTKQSGERDLQLADKLRLKPATGIFYPDKSKLHKEENRKIIPLWFYRAAAIAAVFLFGIFLWNQFVSPSNTDRPIAQQPTKKSVTNPKIDTVKTETTILPDTLQEEKSEKAPVLDEWQMREPDPVEYAENEATKTESNTEKPKELNPISVKEKIQVEIAPVEPEIAMLPTKENSEIMPTDQSKISAPQKATYKTLPELAEKALAKKLNVPEENQDEIANVVAQRITEKVSKMLDTEFTTESAQNDENNTMSYTLRIGSFEFSRTKKK